MEILSVEGKLFRADRHDNSNNRFFFFNFAYAPKNGFTDTGYRSEV